RRDPNRRARLVDRLELDRPTRDVDEAREARATGPSERAQFRGVIGKRGIERQRGCELEREFLEIEIRLGEIDGKLVARANLSVAGNLLVEALRDAAIEPIADRAIEHLAVLALEVVRAGIMVHVRAEVILAAVEPVDRRSGSE